jgi:hypothetical protein
MLMAFVMWLLMKMGVAPSPEDFMRMEREFRERGHHAVLDFGGTRMGTTRWSDDDWSKQTTIGLGYEYLIDRRFNGIGFEVLTQSLGRIIRSGGGTNSFFVGGGLNYYPLRGVRLFMQGGEQIDVHGNYTTVGRIGAGYRFLFFKVGMQPYVFAQQNSKGKGGWAINFRFEY